MNTKQRRQDRLERCHTLCDLRSIDGVEELTARKRRAVANRKRNREDAKDVINEGGDWWYSSVVRRSFHYVKGTVRTQNRKWENETDDNSWKNSASFRHVLAEVSFFPPTTLWKRPQDNRLQQCAAAEAGLDVQKELLLAKALVVHLAALGP